MRLLPLVLVALAASSAGVPALSRRNAGDATKLPLVTTLAVDSDEEGGLLGIAVQPRFEQNRFFSAADPGVVVLHEVYFQDQAGRLRDVVMGPDGAVHLTTSNCDGRGDCPADRDKILRLLPSR